jgi:hypothetical protein
MLQVTTGFIRPPSLIGGENDHLEDCGLGGAGACITLVSSAYMKASTTADGNGRERVAAFGGACRRGSRLLSARVEASDGHEGD